MLYSSGYTDGEVNVRFDGFTGLTDLHSIGYPTGVHRGAAGADGAAKRIGQFFEYGELLFALEPAPAGNDDLGAFERRSFTLDDHAFFHVHFAQRLIRGRGNFFHRERLFVHLRFERLRTDDQKFGALIEQGAGVLVARAERGNRRFDAAVFQLEVADVGDRAAIEPCA